MKRLIAALLALVLAFSITACGDAPAKEAEPTRTPLPVEEREPTVTLEETPDSSCFSAVGYDSTEKVLYVQFRDSGAIYSYDDVPALVYSDLMNAESMGSYYNGYIKGHYTAHRLTD